MLTPTVSPFSEDISFDSCQLAIAHLFQQSSPNVQIYAPLLKYNRQVRATGLVFFLSVLIDY